MIGSKFNKLLVVSAPYKIEGSGYTYYVDVLCDCGVEFRTRKQAVISGSTKSCGCLQRQSASKLKTTVSGKFNSLIVIKDLGVIGRRRMVMAQCDCGVVKEFRFDLIKRGTTKSCGCIYIAERGQATKTHGYSGTPTYSSWQQMRDRCTNPNSTGYENYGGRGIIYDPRWEQFENFLEDMGERPEDTTLDKIDNNGNYCKENCRWADKTTQTFNRRKREGCSSSYVGVYFNIEKTKWHARLNFYREKIDLGYFTTEVEAAKAYDEACFEYYGVRKNFPETQTE